MLLKFTPTAENVVDTIVKAMPEYARPPPTTTLLSVLWKLDDTSETTKDVADPTKKFSAVVDAPTILLPMTLTPCIAVFVDEKKF